MDSGIHKADEASMSRALKAEQIRLLFHQGMPIQLLGLATAFIAMVALRDVVDRTLLIAWFGTMTVVTLLRLWLDYRFTRLAANTLRLERWGRLYLLGTFISGVTWGGLSLFFDPDWPVQEQVIVFAIFCGIIAGAFNSNSSVKWAFPAFFLPPTAMLAYMMLSHYQHFEKLSLLLVIYIALMWISSRRYYRRLRTSLRMQLVNESLARALERSNRRLLALSELDELTGLGNRRTMNRFLAQEWERHIRNEEPLSLLFIDLDYFKQFNDNYGHLEGDAVLVRTAAVFRHYAQRATDLAARFGGEEFAILLPGTDHENAMRMAEQVRADVESLAIPHEGSACAAYITVSIGVATMTARTGTSHEILTAEADRMLYAAKEQGRNRVAGSASAIRNIKRA